MTEDDSIDVLCTMQIVDLSWILKSFSDANATTTVNATTDAIATARAANKTCIFKSFFRNAWGNTKGSLALLNDCCYSAGGCFNPKCFYGNLDRYFVSGGGIGSGITK